MKALGFDALALLGCLVAAAPAAAEQPALSLEGFARQVAIAGGAMADLGPAGTLPKMSDRASRPQQESALDAFVRENGFGTRNIPAEMRLSSPDSVMPDLCPIHGVEHVSMADIHLD